MNILIEDPEIQLEPIAHAYTKRGNILKPVSNVIKDLKPDSNFEIIAYQSAKSLLKNSGKPFTEEEAVAAGKALKKQWDDKGEDRSELGTAVHAEIEYYFENGIVEFEEHLAWVPFLKKLVLFFKNYFKTYNEFKVTFNGIAGTIDKPAQRQNSKVSVVDFFDYKTNVTDEGASNIRFDSIKRTKDTHKHYNRFMKAPVEYFEDCSYNHYAIQLILYAYMMEMVYGIKVGRLGIINVKFDDFSRQRIPTDFELLPVTYCRTIAEQILGTKTLKQLPQVTNVVEVKEDW